MEQGFSLKPEFFSASRKQDCDVEGCQFDHHPALVAALEVPVRKKALIFLFLMSCDYQFIPAPPRQSHMVSFKLTMNHKCCLKGEELS